MTGQLARFAAVGVANTLLSYAAYAALVQAGVQYVAASILAFLLGATSGYLLNRSWTFRARDTGRARVLYVSVQALGLVANAALLWILVGRAGLPELPAQAVAIPPVTLATFLVNRRWTFSTRAARPS